MATKKLQTVSKHAEKNWIWNVHFLVMQDSIYTLIVAQPFLDRSIQNLIAIIDCFDIRDTLPVMSQFQLTMLSCS